MGFVYAVKTFKNSSDGLLRNAHSGICNLHIEIFMVSVKGYTNPAIIHIVFNTILNQIAHGKSKLHLIHIRLNRAETVQDQINVPLICNWTESLQDILQKLIDIQVLHIQICCLLIHFYKRKQVCNDFILPIDLCSDIAHKLLIKLLRHPFLTHQGIGKYLHRGKRCLQLMRHIGNKLISGLIQNLHSGKHFVERIRNKCCLCIIRDRNLLILVSIRQILNGLGNSGKRLYKNRRKHISKKDRQHNNDSCDQKTLLFQFQNILCNFIGGKADQHSTLKLLHFRAFHREGHLNLLCLTIIAAGFLTFEAFDHHSGDQSFSLIYAIGILDNPVIPVN